MKNKETLEEAAESYSNGFPISPNAMCGNAYRQGLEDGFIPGAKWQQEQDKKLYSEEEVDFFVKNILYHIKCYEYNVNNLELISFSNDIELEIEKLYEEFKNK